jgi:oligoendopeptidase F
VPESLDEYRAEADVFSAALLEEYYLQLAGHKETLELAPIYERHADLTTLEACRGLGAAAGEGPASLSWLWRFACEAFLGELTRKHDEQIASLEASLTASVDGEEIPFRMLKPVMANEADRARRERLERARDELAEQHLQAQYVALAETRQEGTTQLGAATYADLYRGFGLELDALAAQCKRFLADTEDVFVGALDRLFRTRVGMASEDAERWDIARLFRAPGWDDGFRSDAMLPALEATLTGLGVDLRAQSNVELDLEARPRKSPRAFCAPIEVPGRVVLVIQPIGGADDWHALFHEAGHMEHYAHTSPHLSVEARRLGDVAVTEGWAMLLELLVNEPRWLERRLDFGRASEFAAEASAVQLYYVRRYAAKLLYELELHGGAELESMPRRYVEYMREATKLDYWEGDCLSDLDPGFYASGYLRAWALEAQLRAFLREEFGTDWFAQPAAGSLLRELWYEGEGMTADDIVREVAGGELDLDAVRERIWESIS